MTTYYRLDDQGEIDWKSEVPRAYLPLRTEEEIVKGHDGRLYLASQCPGTPTPSLEARQAAITAAIQARLDDFARTRGYDNALACISYAASPVARFRDEGLYMLLVRDAAWLSAFRIFDAVEAGERDMPSVEDFMAELPELRWPEDPEPDGEAEAEA